MPTWEEEGKGSKMFTSFMDGPQTKKVVPTPLPIHKLVSKLIESKSISEKGAWWTFFHSKIRLT